MREFPLDQVIGLSTVMEPPAGAAPPEAVVTIIFELASDVSRFPVERVDDAASAPLSAQV